MAAEQPTWEWLQVIPLPRPDFTLGWVGSPLCGWVDGPFIEFSPWVYGLCERSSGFLVLLRYVEKEILANVESS